jgi:hypothetical protein
MQVSPGIQSRYILGCLVRVTQRFAICHLPTLHPLLPNRFPELPLALFLFPQRNTRDRLRRRKVSSTSILAAGCCQNNNTCTVTLLPLSRHSTSLNHLFIFELRGRSALRLPTSFQAVTIVLAPLGIDGGCVSMQQGKVFQGVVSWAGGEQLFGCLFYSAAKISYRRPDSQGQKKSSDRGLACRLFRHRFCQEASPVII